jgi:lipoprotein-anchoring transpeptidase ErfK/SrfK
VRAKLNTTHKVLIAVVAAITFLLLLAVAVWAYDDAQKDQIAPGIEVGGVDIGGRSADSARKLIQREVVAPLRQPIVVTHDGEDYTLSPKNLKQTADVDAMVQEALDKSREGDIFTRVTRYAGGGDVNVDLDPDVGYSKRAVDNFVNALAEQIDQTPQDATVYPDGSKLRPVPGKPGLAVQQKELRQEINQAAHSPGRDQALQVPVASTKPEITKKDLPHEYPRYIFIDRSNYTLRFFHHLKQEKSYTIAVGQQGLETPAGLYHATDKQVDPSWHVPNSAWAGSLAGQVIPPGPADPLKARWIGIVDGAGIHGTDDIGSLGSAASHGCVRMSISDVEDLYDRVDVGDPIYVK